MAGGLGMLGFIGLARESSGGVPVAASAYLEALSESMTVEYERIETVNLAGRISEPDDYLGGGTVAGDVVMAADPVTVGYFLAAGMAEPTSTVVTSGSLYQHVFNPPADSQWDGRFAQRPLSLEVHRDVGSSQQYAGCNVNNLVFNAAYNQDLRMTASLIGVSATNIQKSTPTFVSDPIDPFGFDAASLSLGGAVDANIESFTLSIGNNLEGVGTLSNKRTIHKIRRAGFFAPRFTISAAFEDVTNFERFRNQTEVPIKVHFARATSYGITFDIPRAIFTAFPTGVSGRGRQNVEITGMCRWHVGSATSLTVTLLSSVNSYD